MTYTWNNQTVSLQYDPAKAELNIAVAGSDVTWAWEGAPFITLANGVTLNFTDAHCESRAYKTGVADGVRATYSRFAKEDGTFYPYTVETYVYLDIASGDLKTEVRLDGDQKGEVAAVAFPPRMKFDAAEGEGYTVLPRMQGTLVPAGHPIHHCGGEIFERDAYIPMYGQVKNGCG